MSTIKICCDSRGAETESEGEEGRAPVAKKQECRDHHIQEPTESQQATYSLRNDIKRRKVNRER